MGTGIIFDDSLWPLLISHFPRKVSDSDFEEYLRQGAAYLERGELYVSVLDMGRLSLPTAEQRQRQLEWMRGKERAMREQVIGCAFIIHSPLIRLSLSTIFHILPLPAPYVAVSDMASGLRWALGRLEERGLHEAAERVRGLLLAASAGDAPPNPTHPG